MVAYGCGEKTCFVNRYACRPILSVEPALQSVHQSSQVLLQWSQPKAPVRIIVLLLLTLLFLSVEMALRRCFCERLYYEA